MKKLEVDEVAVLCGLQPRHEYRMNKDNYKRGTTTTMLCNVVAACSNGEGCAIVGHSRDYTQRLVAQAKEMARKCGVYTCTIRGLTYEKARSPGLSLLVFYDHYYGD